MSWGWAMEGSHFFLSGRDEGAYPEGFSFVAALWDAERDAPGVFREMGEDAVIEYCDRLRAEPAARQELALRVRRAWWWVRNRRSAGWDAGGVQQVKASEIVVLMGVQLLELGGCAPSDIWNWCRCQSHACVCDGCDLLDGRRFAVASC